MQIDRRHFIRTASVAGAAGAACAACAALGTPFIAHAQAAREFKIGLITGPSHNWSKAMLSFGEALKKESGGRISAVIFPGGQLGNEATMVQQMQSGALDMGFLTVAEFSNRNPNFAAFFAPYLVRDVSHATRVLKSQASSEVLEQMTDLGLVGLGFGLGGMRHMLSRTPAPTAADQRVKKFRITPFAPLRDFYNIAGIAPTPIPLPGLFDALANAQIDGADVDLELVWTLKLFQQAKHLLLTNHMMFPVVSVMSGRVFSTLSQPDRQLLRKVLSAELEQLFARYTTGEKEWLEQIRGSGIDVQDVGKDYFKDVAAEWEKQWLPKAPALPKLRAAAAATA